MLLCVFTTQVSAIMDYDVVVSTEETENEQPVLKQLSPETVVPNYVFSFGEILFQQNFVFQFIETEVETASWISAPINAYLAKLLEHHIAINAP